MLRKLLQFDPVQKEILDEYLWKDPYAIMLIGHYGSGKTLLLVEMMGIKIAKLLRKGKKIRVIITADVPKNSFLLRDLKEKYFGFIEYKNATKEPKDQIELIVEPLNELMKKYEAIPDVNIIRDVLSGQQPLLGNGWIKDH